MFNTLILTIVMACSAAVFWCIEALPYVNTVKRNSSMRGPLKILRQGMRNAVAVPKLFPLFLDLVVTVWLTGLFTLGGLFGTMIGLTMSNVLSIFILIYMYRR